MNTKNFGIFSPVLGMRKDFPSILLEKAYNPDSENIIFQKGEVHRAKMRLKELTDTTLTKIQTPDTYPIIHYHRFVDSNTESESLFVFTKAHIYLWNSGAKTLDQKFECNSNCDMWNTVTYNNKVIATNNIDKVLKWATGDATFTPLGSDNGIEYETTTYLTKAKYLTVYENYLILGYIMENAVSCPTRIRWCDLGDDTNWKSGDSGASDVGKDDVLTGFGNYQGLLIIFKEDSHYKMWLVSSSTVFNMSVVNSKIGCKSPHSIVNDENGELFFFASDYTFRGIGMGEISQAVNLEVKKFIPGLIPFIKSKYIVELNEIWWSIPYGTDATANNKVFVFHKGYWSQLNLSISAFGEWSRNANYTWATLPFSTWDSWGWDKWDSREGEMGSLIDLGGDYSGYTYALHGNELDDDTAYTGYTVMSTDFTDQQGLTFYKRLLQMQLYFNRESSGTAEVYIKRDQEPSWQNAGSVSLLGNNDVIIKDLVMDYRAKTFLIKVQGANRFRFLGAIFKYVPSGAER